jgi:hypothetical protein
MLRQFHVVLLAIAGLVTGCDAPPLPTGNANVVTTERSPAGDNTAAQSLRAAQAPADPPQIPDSFVFRPTFHTSSGDVPAGTAFAVTIPGQNRLVLLSAIHLLGPMGGLEADIAAEKIGTEVAELTLAPLFRGGEISLPARAITIPGASPMGNAAAGPGDVVAFWLPPNDVFEPLTLATENPPAGMRVWLVASLLGGAPASQRLHAARITADEQADSVYYIFDKSGLEMRATSGAPIVDSEGRVVAINLGGGERKGHPFGVGNPVGRFRPALEKAIAASSLGAQH